jgi:hypothetical protein
MKRYYPTVFGALCLLLAIIIFVADRSSSKGTAIADCISAGGSFNLSSGLCTPAGSSAPSTSVSPAHPASPLTQTVPSSGNAVSGGIGSVFATPANVVVLPVYYDVSSTTDTIRVASPSHGNGVASPLQVTGTARGEWFSEGSFPVVLVDSKGRILAKGNVASQGNWQTTDFVPFSGVLTFARQQSASTGSIYFLESNPSGMAANAQAAVEPVVFQ